MTEFPNVSADHTPNVVIIGAGPAGLTAAYVLATRYGIPSTILEADSQVGGISRTVERDGWRFDIGGHRFFTKVKEVEAFWHEVLPDEDFMLRPRMSRIYYEGKYYDYPLKASNALKNLGIWEAFLCVMSYFAAQRIKNLSLFNAVVNALLPKRNQKDITSLIEEFQYPKYGPGMMWERCRDLVEARGCKVMMNTRVVAIHHEGGSRGLRIDTDTVDVRLGRVRPDKAVQLVRGDREAFGLRGRSAEQRVALDLLLDPEIGIVSLGGRAGTGKSALALCAGLEAVMERRQHRKVIVFRPLYAVGGQELGYLPGSEADKMGPWAQAVFDTLSAVTTQDVIDEVINREMMEVLPLTHIRGRSLHDAFVIVDEAQSLERGVLLTVLSRIGSGSRVVLTHDIAQRDNLRVGRHDGVIAVIEKLKGHPLFAHTTLVRSERSQIAALVTEMLEDSGL